jgi:hypothetical protein
MLTDSAAAQFSFVPSEYVLVLAKHSPELLLLLFSQVVINSNLLGDLFPSCVHLRASG